MFEDQLEVDALSRVPSELWISLPRAPSELLRSLTTFSKIWMRRNLSHERISVRGQLPRAIAVIVLGIEAFGVAWVSEDCRG